eukprot:6055771-Prymnesium_polylepis.1
MTNKQGTRTVLGPAGDGTRNTGGVWGAEHRNTEHAEHTSGVETAQERSECESCAPLSRPTKFSKFRRRVLLLLRD